VPEPPDWLERVNATDTAVEWRRCYGASRQLNGCLARSFVYLGETSEVLRDFGEVDEAELNVRKLDEANWNILVIAGES
jgi:hypothetical protein